MHLGAAISPLPRRFGTHACSFVGWLQVNAPHLNATIKPGALRYIGRRGNHRVVEDSDSPALASCQHLFARKFSSAEEALRLTQGPRSACNVEPSTPQRTTTRTRLSVLALMQNHPKTQG